VNCTPKAGTTTSGGTCTATLSQALSSAPPVLNRSDRAPKTPPVAPLVVSAFALALLLIAGMRHRRLQPHRRLVYAFACALVLIGITAGFAGCGGGSSSGGGGGTPTTHVDSITAVYGGDSVYIGSTSQAVAITVSNP
jgi:hypothetical protein